MNNPKQLRSLSQQELSSLQLEKLNALLRSIAQRPFYVDRLSQVDLPLRSLDQVATLPLLTKADLIGDGPGAPGKIFDLRRSQYTRLHQTSGTKGFPMVVLDTPEDWQWWLRC